MRVRSNPMSQQQRPLRTVCCRDASEEAVDEESIDQISRFSLADLEGLGIIVLAIMGLAILF